MKQRVYKTFTAYLWLTLASAVYALGFNWCYVPNQIGFGGITGVGQIVNHLLILKIRIFAVVHAVFYLVDFITDEVHVLGGGSGAVPEVLHLSL